MRKLIGSLLALAVVLTYAGTAWPGDDLVENPMYKFWASFKPGSTSVYHEVTKHSGAEKASLPSGKEDKLITYKLLSVDDKKAVVQIVVVEQTFLGALEAAPTKMIYPAKIKKAHLEAVLEEFGAKKSGEEMVKVGKDEIKCKCLEGSRKLAGETLDYKFAYSDTVPGGVVRRERITKDGDKVIAETQIQLKSYVLGKEKKKKTEK